MQKVIGIIAFSVCVFVGSADTADAETVCSTLEPKKSYLCTEDRHDEVLPGQEEWWWFVDPQKGVFHRQYIGTNEIGYEKVYLCEPGEAYTATITVSYPFPHPNYVTTSTEVECDAPLTTGVPGPIYFSPYPSLYVWWIRQCLMFGTGPYCEAGW